MLEWAVEEEPALKSRESILAVAVIMALPLFAWAQHDHPGNRPTAKPLTSKTVKPALKPADGAAVKIIVPAQGQVIKGDKVPVEFKLTKGKRGHHTHAYVDGELVGMFESEKGTLNGIKPGKRVLELRVVATDHETELDASDQVAFTVK